MRSGNQVRIMAQLIQASADKHIWAQSYEGEIRDTLVLQNLARAGADLAGVVTFHAALNTPRPEDAKNIMGKVLVLHGADDPLAPDAEVLTFEKEMRDANVDWQLISYGNTVHSFTNWDLDSDHSKPAAYSAKSDARSWAAMRTFFEEIFADRNPRLFGSNLLFPFSMPLF